MIRRTLFAMLFLVMSGCAQDLRSHELDKTEKIPAISYEAYLFVAGISERSRAVFLRRPDAEITVEPASPEILTTTASYGEAMTFMKMKLGSRSTSTEVITYKGNPIGYLITYTRPGENGEVVETNFTERGGKVFFSAREIRRSDD